MKQQIISWRTWYMVALLYLTQGMPLGLAMDALPTILKSNGASLEALSFLPLVALPWVIKFLWASWVDNHFVASMGRRRSWLLPMQAIVLAVFVLVMLLGIDEAHLVIILVLAAIASLASATQDIATDGLVAETFTGRHLAHANALQVGGTMVGFFVGGAGVMVLVGHFGLSVGLLLPVAIIVSSLVLLMGFKENSTKDEYHQVAKQQQHMASLRSFIQRPRACLLLAMAFLSSLAMVAGFGLGKLVLIDAGWQVTQVGQLGMMGGVFTILLGCGGGAWLVGKVGSMRIFILGLSMTMVSAILWLYLLSIVHIEFWQAFLATALSSFGAGSASVALMTQAMLFAKTSQQAGTDMTAVQSMRDLGEMLMSSSLVAVAAILGYGAGFSVGLVAAVLAIGLLYWHNSQVAH